MYKKNILCSNEKYQAFKHLFKYTFLESKYMIIYNCNIKYIKI